MLKKTRTQKIIFVFIIILVLSDNFSQTAYSEKINTMVINEIAAYEKQGQEWIEIFNAGENVIDISNWKFFENKTNHKLKTIQGSTLIKPGTYAIIAQNTDAFLEKYPNFSGILIDSSWGSLKEEGEEIGLLNEQDEFIEHFTYLESKDTSLERVDAWTNDLSETNWKIHSSSGTPGEKNEASNSQNDKKNATENSTISSDKDVNRPPTKLKDEKKSTNPQIFTDIKIYAFLPDPKELDSENEWIEIKNEGEQTINLKGLMLDDDEGGSKPFTFDDEYIQAETIMRLKRTITGISLNNTGDTIRLLTIDKKIIDTISYEGTEEDVAYIRTKNGVEMNKKNTKKQEKSKKKTKQVNQNGDFSEKILITELLPNPKGSDTENEWIELFNSDDKDINLANWKLDDSEEGSKPYIFSNKTIIKKNEYLIIPRTLSKLSLNNNKDSVRLYDFEGTLIDEVGYEKAQDGWSYALINLIEKETSENITNDSLLTATKSTESEWQWIDEITEGLQNPVYEIFRGIVIEEKEEPSEKNASQFFLDHKSEKLTIRYDPESQSQNLIQTLALPGTEVEITGKKLDEKIYKLKKIDILKPGKRQQSSKKSIEIIPEITLFLIPLAYLAQKYWRKIKPHKI